ncbi:hypothetical protein BH10ACT3_BH10ACT3_16320 [soil metagenome]
MEELIHADVAASAVQGACDEMGLFRRNTREDVDVDSFLANLGRLDAVRRSGLMGLPRSRSLDELARDAATHFHTSMAFMSILDDRRIFHAASSGGEFDDEREDAAEASFCQYVVALDDVLVVNDSLTDDLVRDHPATKAGLVRAYLGVPVRSNGHTLGSFCVVDEQAREWTADDIYALRDFADAAMRSPGVTSAAQQF